MKKDNSAILIIGLVIAVALLFQYGQGFSILTFGDYSIEQTKTINCLGTSCTLMTPYFGSITSGTSATIDGHYGSSWNICGDNDEKITISNSFSTNGNLVLTSSGSGRDGKACSGNYINAKMTVPAGTLKVICSLTASTPTDCPTTANCEISNLFSDYVYSKGAPPNFYIDGGTKTKTITKEFNISEPKDLEIIAKGSIGGGCSEGSSYSSIVTIEFEESSKEPECTSGNIKCESTIYFICSDGKWVNQGLINGQCGYSGTTIPNNETNQTVIYQNCNILGCPSGYDCINNVCIKETVIYQNCNTLGCPSGYNCINNVCVKKVEIEKTLAENLQTFLEENTLVSIILLILFMLFLWMVIKK